MKVASTDNHGAISLRVGLPVHLHVNELTFTCFGALGPGVIKISVAGYSTFLEPCAARKTATAFAVLFVEATLGTSARRRNCS